MKVIIFLLFVNIVICHFQLKKPKELIKRQKLSRVGNIFDNATKTDVLIIGAGLSGLETARLLNKYGIETINLEARDRIGGRIWSVESKNKHIFDLGAAWIHGVNGSMPNGLIKNHLWELTLDANIETRGTLQKDYQSFYPNNKKNFDLNKWYNEYVSYIDDNIKVPFTNKTLHDFAEEFSVNKNFSIDEKNAFFSFLHFAIESYEGTELDTIGAKNFFEVTAIHYGEEHVFHKTGYVSLINYLAKDNKDIRINRIVNKIDYNGESVKVYTKNGEIYEANYVLVTVPLGVLKGNSIEFSPELPDWKKDTINRLGFGILDKIVLLWDKAWWNSTNYYFLRVSQKPTEFGYWVNANKWNDKPALICYFVGKEAQRLENLEKSELIKETLNALRSMFPKYDIPQPIDSLMTYWKSDPFSNGSYTFVSKNQRYEDPLQLSMPIDDKVLFAGEATSTDSYGYAHGALQSARREATRLLYVYDLLKEEYNSCSILKLKFSSLFYSLLIIYIFSFI